ncbi:Monocarboxylate transporter 5 [Halotydeus destructor]|nr:Monocarboxylate transporter 5 [Halotydeus destructor]
MKKPNLTRKDSRPVALQNAPRDRLPGQSQNQGQQRSHIVIHRTPDAGWSWVIVASCFTINAIIFGIYRTYGVLFVALLQTYRISREEAAWPFSLCLTIFHMTGLISGALSSYYTSRQISIIGCLIASAGFAGCFLATSVTHVTILIGIVIGAGNSIVTLVLCDLQVTLGFGYGLIGTQTPVIINQYFSKYRATASGIALAGGTVGSFVFPPLVKVILSEYSLHGCFLILGGIVLNTLPIALLLRPPIPSRKVVTVENDDIEAAAAKQLLDGASDGKSLEAVLVRSQHKFKMAPHSTPYLQATRSLILNSFIQEKRLACSKLNETFDRETFLNAVNKEPVEPESQPLCNAEKTNQCPLSPLSAKETWLQKFGEALRQNVALIGRLVRNPLFIILCTTQVSFTWGWTTFSMVIVDFAVDRGIDILSAVTLLSAFAGSDLIGRLASGWISDKGFIKRRNVAFASILSIGLLLWLLPIAKTYPVLLCISLALGLFSGSLMILFSILLVEYVGIKTMPVALGASTFCCGVSTLMRPVVIGYFRDNHDSYDGLFQMIGIVCMLVAILWLIEPCAQLWQERKDRLERRLDRN